MRFVRYLDCFVLQCIRHHNPVASHYDPTTGDDQLLLHRLKGVSQVFW